MPAAAQQTVTGQVFPLPPWTSASTQIEVGGAGAPTALPGTLFIGPTGSFTASSLSVGNRLASGDVTLGGAGAVVTLLGPDGSGLVANPLVVGGWGPGTMTVAGGAVLNAGIGNALCVASNCNVFIGNAAGSTGTLTITDPGTVARLGSSGFVVGNAAVFTTATAGFDFGTPGGATTGTLNVLNGGTLQTYNAAVSIGGGGSAPTGTESTSGNVTIAGAGSLWSVERNPASGAVGLSIATAPNATATFDVSNGGALSVSNVRTSPATDNSLPFVNIGVNGGSATMTVQTGGTLRFSGDTGVLNVGRSGPGISTLAILSGGTVAGTTSNGLLFASVGRDGATGTLNVSGTGSQLTLSGVGGVNTQGLTGTGGVLQVGRSGPGASGAPGTGSVNVTSGGRISIGDGGGAAASGTGVQLGAGTGSTGSMTIDGLGSRVDVQATGAGTSARVLVGVGGSIVASGAGAGTLTVSNGGQLAVSSGSDARVEVGSGPGASGTLNVTGGGGISANRLTVGAAGTGTATFDAGALTLGGVGPGPSGAPIGGTLLLGVSGGSGAMSLANGSTVTFTGTTPSTGILLGGSPLGPGGSGVLTLSGGSTVTFAPGTSQSFLSVGANGGTGTLLIGGASSIALTADGRATVGAGAGATGTVTVDQSSSLSTGTFFGVSHDGNASTGGTGTAIVNGILTADVIRIGTGGFVGGTGTLVGTTIVSGGTLAPGLSPGRMVFDGGFDFESGRIVLEVAPDGAGGWLTDRLVFASGSAIDLAGVDLLFAFLDGADPEAFRASGLWTLDTFFKTNASPGAGVGFDLGISALGALSALFSDALYAATSERYLIDAFAFDAELGVTQLAVVPVPGSLVLVVLGLTLLGATARRRRGPG